MARKRADLPLGPVLRSFRQERAYTIEEAASKAKLHPVYYGDVERGKRNPTVAIVDRILAALQVSWGEMGSAIDAHRQLSNTSLEE